jgi:hypothetical protein
MGPMLRCCTVGVKMNKPRRYGEAYWRQIKPVRSEWQMLTNITWTVQRFLARCCQRASHHPPTPKISRRGPPVLFHPDTLLRKARCPELPPCRYPRQAHGAPSVLTDIGHDLESLKGVVSDFSEEARSRVFPSPPFGGFAFFDLFGDSIVGINTYKGQ